ncbi:MAG: DUF5131 family protein [Brevinema sp.]
MEFIDIGKKIKTLNPVNGCTIGCSYCYARKISNRFHITPEWEKPVFIKSRLQKVSTKKPNTFLMTSMSDFSDWANEWRDNVFLALTQNPQHTYLFLTKRPDRINYTISSPQTWVGVSVTLSNDIVRISQMTSNIIAPHYFITFEPLFDDVGVLPLEKIEWIVIGTETGNRKGKITAQKSWITNIVKQAKAKNIPVFMKKSLYPIIGEENMLQEFPASFRGM